MFFFFKQKTAYEMRISDWSSDVCSSDLDRPVALQLLQAQPVIEIALDIQRRHVRITRIVEPPTRPQAPAIRPDRIGVGCARLPVFAMIQCRQIPPMNAASTPTPLLLSYKSSPSGSRMIPPVSARRLQYRSEEHTSELQ